MEFVHRLPFILGAAMALIVGSVSTGYNTEPRDIYIRMTVSMIVFYVIGLYARSTINRISAEVEEKKEEERLRLEEEVRLAHEEAKAKAEEAKKSSTIDHRVGEFEEEFSPLTVSEYINSEN